MSDTQTVETPAAEVEAKPAKSPKQPKPCACSQYEVRTDEGVTSTGCTAQTVRSFVPGHDAKLKSMLIKAAIAGQDVTRLATSEYPESTLTARQAAEDFNFAGHIDKGVETHEKREAVRQEKADARAAKKAEADAKKADAQAEAAAAREAKKEEAAARREAKKAERDAAAAQRKAEREAKKAEADAEKARKAQEKADAAAAKAAAAAAASDEG